MATTTISGLPETSTVNSVTVAPVDFGGGTFKVTVGNLGAHINTNATTISATGNITGGNLLASGVTISTNTISAAGTVTGGNLQVSGVLVSTGTISASGNIVANNHISTGVLISTNTVSATGNITGGNISTSGVLSVTAGITAGSIAAPSHTGSVVSMTGNITGANLITAGSLTVNSGNAITGAATAIVNGASNAVGNIGSTSSYFNQVFAQATTALYADLAEVYEADTDYAPGTVVSFGGSKEVTISTRYADPAVAGVISANPSYLMNNGLTADHRAIVALTGRVPTSVTGSVTKGSMMVSAGNGQARACATPAMGTVIGKALENFDGESGIIEIVVGRM
jgi:filamentous hemagglutinin